MPTSNEDDTATVMTDQAVAPDGLWDKDYEIRRQKEIEDEKRKEKERIAAGEPLPLLPSGPWSNILDCFRVEEADRLLLSMETVGLIPDDAFNTTVKVLNILRPSCFKTAHRFVGAKEVNIPCLIIDEGVFGCDSDVIMDEEVIENIVPLLARMPKLEKAYVGEKMADSDWFEWTPPTYGDAYFFYSSRTCNKPENHRELFNRLMTAFCNAFKDGLLPRDLDLRLFRHMDSCNGSRSRGCDLCRNICESFPPKALMSVKLCYSLRKRLPIIADRPGGRDYLHSKEAFLKMLKRHHVRSLHQEVDHEHDPLHYFILIDYLPRDLDMFDTMVNEYGCDVGSITSEEVFEALDVEFEADGSIPCDIVLRQSTYDRLWSIGLQMTGIATTGTFQQIEESIGAGGLHVCSNESFDAEVSRQHPPIPFPHRDEDSSLDEVGDDDSDY